MSSETGPLMVFPAANEWACVAVAAQALAWLEAANAGVDAAIEKTIPKAKHSEDLFICVSSEIKYDTWDTAAETGSSAMV
ncbi:MAG TPA: hypothetical protein VFL78_01775 [Rhodanobacteraceae bacterium]|nr:hypothetical protein [Rhodanobacteraceae bacterium]